MPSLEKPGDLEMQKDTLWKAALIIIIVSVAFANCISEAPSATPPDTSPVSNNYAYLRSIKDPASNNIIDLYVPESGNNSLSILETRSTQIIMDIKYYGGAPEVSSVSDGHGKELHMVVLFKPTEQDGNTDITLNLPDNVAYTINSNYWRDSVSDKGTMNIGSFKGPVVISVDGKKVVDKGPIAASPKPSDSVPEPTRIVLSVEPDKILVGGGFYDESLITAQLYYMDEPLRKKGVNITFQSLNDTVAVLPIFNYNYTDNGGSTKIWVKSGYMPGNVKITAYYNGTNGIITNSTYIDTTRWGAISGLVRDKNDAGIRNANVSIYNCQYNESSKKWDNTGLASLPENPQLTNDGRFGPAGLFAFYAVPEGMYNITAEKGGHYNSSIVRVEPGTETCFISLSDYEYVPENPGSSDKVAIPAPIGNRGTIWGIVDDQNGVSVLNAKVTLSYATYNNTIGMWERGKIVDIPGNPQYSRDADTGQAGEYRFDNVLNGVYYVTAEQNGHSYYTIANLKGNLAISFVNIPYYSSWMRP